MEKKPILIVDDEKNIRLTLSHALESLNLPVEAVVNGEEALRKLQEKTFSLVFLDLKMPGMDGMEVLRRIKDDWPQIRVIIITAHGTIDSAVEAMKLGAADFIQKPFTPVEIRELATLVLEREVLDGVSAVEYGTLIELSKRYISDRDFATARETIRKAISADPSHPEAYNLLGALYEAKKDTASAEQYYRKSIESNPNTPDLYVSLASFYVRQNMADKAVGELNAALQKNPNSISALMALAGIYQSQNKNDLAKQNYQKVLKINPKFPPAANNLAYIYADENTNIDEALNLAQMASCVGQQAMRGKRIETGYRNRTLSCFKKDDLMPISRGFIKSGFKK